MRTRGGGVALALTVMLAVCPASTETLAGWSPKAGASGAAATVSVATLLSMQVCCGPTTSHTWARNCAPLSPSTVLKA